VTRRRLNMVIFGVGSFYLLLIFLFFGSDPDGVFVQQLRYAMPLLVGLPAAGLVESFRRRSALQDALRRLYYSVVDDLQTAIRYTKRKAPTEDEYFDTLKTISTSIDRVRAHFSNITRAGLKPNLYPIEGVKTFYTWIEYLGGGDHAGDELWRMPPSEYLRTEARAPAQSED